MNKVDKGIVTNLPSLGQAWSAGRNVSFKKGCVYKIFGKTLLTTISGNLPIRAMFVFKGYDNVWRNIVCCDTKIYSYTNNFTVQQDITPSTPPSSTSLDSWTFGIIGGMPLLSNGVNPPYKWDNFASVMTTLTGAPSVCKALYVHNNRVIVGNIQEGAYAFPARLRWSDIIDPTDWNRDLKLSSGKHDCVNQNTSLTGTDVIQAITSHPFGNRLVVFTERNIWYGNPVEFPRVYTFDSIDRDIGLIAPRLFVKTPKGLYFMSQEAVYRIGGDGVMEELSFPIRNSIFPLLNKSKISTSFCYYKPSTREVVFAVPLGTDTTPSTAFVWQEETNSWTIWSVDYAAHSTYFDSSNTTWDTIPDAQWNLISDSRWDNFGLTGVLPSECVGNSSGQILKQDFGYNNNGVAIDAYIETGDFDMNTPYLNKVIDRIWLILKPQASISEVMIQVGVRPDLHHDIEWGLPLPLTIGVTNFVNCRTQGKYIRLRLFSNVLDSPFIIEGYGVEWSAGGTR